MAKAVLRGKFIAQNTFIGKEEKCQSVISSSHFMCLENEEQNKPKAKRKYIRAAINYI